MRISVCASRFARARAGCFATMSVLVACATLLAACTFTPWQTLGRPGDDSDAAASGDVAASAPAAVSSTPVDAPTSKVVAEVQPTASGASGDLYRVKKGDTLYRIATAHGERAADVAAWNKLPASGEVKVGQMLRVKPPAKGAAASPPAPSVAAAAAASAAPVVPVAAAPTVPPTKPPVAKAAAAARLAWPMNGSVATRFAPGKSRGIVIAGAPGQPVKAAAAGRVTYVGSGIQGYGKLVIIKHDANLLTAYGRNGRLLVKQGDAVKTGQTIATSGADSAGVGTLLFEVRDKGKPVDPQEWLPRPQS
jgi:lipoprotein NlpD